MNNSKILSFLSLFLVIGYVHGYNNDLRKQYQPILEQFLDEERKAYKQLDKEMQKFLNTTLSEKKFREVEQTCNDTCWQTTILPYWIPRLTWEEHINYFRLYSDGTEKIYTNDKSCNRSKELQRIEINILKQDAQWSNVQLFIQQFNTYRTLNKCLQEIFDINNDNSPSQKTKKERIDYSINKLLTISRSLTEIEVSMLYAMHLTYESKAFINEILEPIIKNVIAGN